MKKKNRKKEEEERKNKKLIILKWKMVEKRLKNGTYHKKETED